MPESSGLPASGVAMSSAARRLPKQPVRARRPRRDFAVEYLNALIEDADQEELTATLARIAERSGGPRLAEKVELNADTLYRTLCRRGNPELRSAAALLKAMGIRLTLEVIPGTAALRFKGIARREA